MILSGTLDGISTIANSPILDDEPEPVTALTSPRDQWLKIPHYATLQSLNTKFDSIRCCQMKIELGRSDECHPATRTHFNDTRYSRVHCSLSLKERNDGGYNVMLTDHSANGTYVNGNLVGKNKSRQLANNDIVSLLVPSMEHSDFYETCAVYLFVLSDAMLKGNFDPKSVTKASNTLKLLEISRLQGNRRGQLTSTEDQAPSVYHPDLQSRLNNAINPLLSVSIEEIRSIERLFQAKQFEKTYCRVYLESYPGNMKTTQSVPFKEEAPSVFHRPVTLARIETKPGAGVESSPRLLAAESSSSPRSESSPRSLAAESSSSPRSLAAESSSSPRSETSSSTESYFLFELNPYVRLSSEFLRVEVFGVRRPSGSNNAPVAQMLSFVRIPLSPFKNIQQLECFFELKNIIQAVKKAKTRSALPPGLSQTSSDAHSSSLPPSKPFPMISNMVSKQQALSGNYDSDSALIFISFQCSPIRASRKHAITLREKVIAKGKPFQDPEFPAIGASLFSSPSFHAKTLANIEWRRAPDVFGGVGQHSVFVDGAKPSDILVSEGSKMHTMDIWALTPMVVASSVAEQMLLFYSEKYGIVQFVLRCHSQWRVVTIDDRVPCNKKTGKPLYARSSHPHESWVTLLEKANAKLHGNYEKLFNETVDRRDTTIMPSITDDATVRLCGETKRIPSHCKISVHQVWSALVDFKNWSKWNTVVVDVKLLDRGNNPPDAPFNLGTRVELETHIGGKLRRTNHVIDTWLPPNCLSWYYVDGFTPAWIQGGSRYLKVFRDDATQDIVIQSWEHQNGLAAWGIKLAVGRDIETAFTQMQNDFITYLEKLYGVKIHSN